MDKLRWAAIGIAICFHIAAIAPVRIMANVAIARNLISSLLDDVACPTLEMAARVLCSAAMQVISVHTRFVRAQQFSSIVFVEETVRASKSEAAAFISAACFHVCLYALTALTQEAFRVVHKSLASWAQL
jgi:hypothetical protein